jgi:periplasmic divalent cation tolerance protein
MDQQNEMILVLTTLPDTASAEKLARRIIETHTAACVNQLSSCTSTYRWNDNIEVASEVPLLIKTTKAAYPHLEKLILEAHPYELPEIIAVPVDVGLPAYLSWVKQETEII